MAKNRHFAGTGPAPSALIRAAEAAAYWACRPIGAGGEDVMQLDLNRIFPMQDPPSARLMRLKAFCLYRAGVLSEGERAAVARKAKAFIENPRFRAALHPRRAA